ncbi:hypothetical protein GMOD_00002545 [Pyrenophora seminiperda CCB06]|uniref:Uncharacterized protein n=1 Tax=Pyrenophora seminiperda CCB06 TaxID=1302712 RepID=A0A3M7M2H7_9PLEO|nr:hypothetical protein GMOD_00002545 [Pyrenophora seminiperda CCB06]
MIHLSYARLAIKSFAGTPETKVCGDMASRLRCTVICFLNATRRTTLYAPPIRAAYAPKSTQFDAHAAILRRWSDVYTRQPTWSTVQAHNVNRRGSLRLAGYGIPMAPRHWLGVKKRRALGAGSEEVVGSHIIHLNRTSFTPSSCYHHAINFYPRLLRRIPTVHIDTMSGSLLLSLLFPLLVLAQDTGGELPPPGYNGGSDNPQDPSDAGAAGSSKSAFSLSGGALAAIIVVAVVVVLGSIASGTLWWLAKKRQWDVRASIRRASRRFTGRSTAGPDTSKQAQQNRQNRRTGIRLNSPPPGRNANKMRDLEKGLPLSNKEPQLTTTITSRMRMRCCAAQGKGGQPVSGDEVPVHTGQRASLSAQTHHDGSQSRYYRHEFLLLDEKRTNIQRVGGPLETKRPVTKPIAGKSGLITRSCFFFTELPCICIFTQLLSSLTSYDTTISYSFFAFGTFVILHDNGRGQAGTQHFEYQTIHNLFSLESSSHSPPLPPEHMGNNNTLGLPPLPPFCHALGNNDQGASGTQDRTIQYNLRNTYFTALKECLEDNVCWRGTFVGIFLGYGWVGNAFWEMRCCVVSECEGEGWCATLYTIRMGRLSGLPTVTAVPHTCVLLLSSNDYILRRFSFLPRFVSCLVLAFALLFAPSFAIHTISSRRLPHFLGHITLLGARKREHHQNDKHEKLIVTIILHTNQLINSDQLYIPYPPLPCTLLPQTPKYTCAICHRSKGYKQAQRIQNNTTHISIRFNRALYFTPPVYAATGHESTHTHTDTSKHLHDRLTIEPADEEMEDADAGIFAVLGV